MSAPRWARALLGRLADPELVDEVVGDLEEAHLRRVERHGRWVATALTSLEALDMAFALRWRRRRVLRRLGKHVPADMGTARRRRMPPVSWLDFKLGLRMLARYPGMTVIGGTAMALGIAIGVVTLHFLTTMLFPDRPFAEPDRIVTIDLVDTRTTRSERRLLPEMEAWRRELRSVDHLGARLVDMPNFAPMGATPFQVRAVSISASAFELSAVPPALGRPLLAYDALPPAPPVVVLSDWLWRTSYDEDPDIVGRTATLGGEIVTIVGVMPRGFTLEGPSNETNAPFSPDLWTPLRNASGDYAVGNGPRIDLFGRLAPGVTAEAAQAELEALVAARVTESPERYGHLTPRVMTFRKPLGLDQVLSVRSLIPLSAAVVMLITVVLCANVALLMYARAAARQSEIVVRSALGATRARIVAQLFAEALAIAGVASLIALVGASWAVRWIDDLQQRIITAAGGRWEPTAFSLSSDVVLVVVGLALLGAVVAGVLPGMKLTGRKDAVALRRYADRGSAAPLGGVWSVILVGQVALTTTILPISALYGAMLWTMARTDWGLPATEYVTARLEMDGAPLRGDDAGNDDFGARYVESYEALRRGLEDDPRVVGVTFADELPGFYHPRARIEVARPTGREAASDARFVQVAHVGPTFFDVLGAGILAGRGLGPADLDGDARAVVVNESFVRDVLGGGSALGRRIRYATGGTGDRPAPWLEIVGVVQELAMYPDPLEDTHAGIYRPLRQGTYPVRVAVHAPGGGEPFVRRLREIASEAAPELRLFNPVGLDRAVEGLLLASDASFRLLLVAGGFALLLTNAGIYSIVSFSVSRRTREIGLRVALGANRVGVVSTVMSGMARRIALGVALGAALGLPLPMLWATSEGPLQGGLTVWLIVAIYLAAMALISAIGCVTPVRRALAIEPREALAAGG